MQPTPPRRLVFTGRTRERGKDPAGAQTTFSLITHIKFGKFGNFFFKPHAPRESKNLCLWPQAIKLKRFVSQNTFINQKKTMI